MDNPDHDLLIRVDEKVDLLILRMQSLEDNNAKRIDALEKEKLNVRDSYPYLYKTIVEKSLDDHETRLRSIEQVWESAKGKYAILAVIGMAMISIFITWISKRL